MAPNTTDNTVESVSEQFQKLDLKKLAREQGIYQVYPKISVSKYIAFDPSYNFTNIYVIVPSSRAF
jgi:hypothetical protein